MKRQLELTPTELHILATLLEDAPANRFEKWENENGEAITEEFLSNLYDKLNFFWA